MIAADMISGGFYNWKHLPGRLIYLGRWLRDNRWHQFAKVDSPTVVWCEVRDADLSSFEASKPADLVRPNPDNAKEPDMAKHELDPITPDDFSGSDDPYTPDANLHAFTGAAALDAHFTTHGLTSEQTESALDQLLIRDGKSVGFIDWNKLVRDAGMPQGTTTGRVPSHLPIEQVMATVPPSPPVFDNRLEIMKISDAAYDLVERARCAGLVLTIETTRFDDPLVMGNYQLQVALRPSLASIRERDARRALHDAEFEAAERDRG